MKTFFDGVFLDRKKLEEEGIGYPIKLEYFRTLRDKENVEAKYGIQVVKTEYLDDNINIETKEIDNIVDSKYEVERILEILKKYEVTPVGLKDVIYEIL